MKASGDDCSKEAQLMAYFDGTNFLTGSVKERGTVQWSWSSKRRGTCLSAGGIGGGVEGD